MTGRPTPHLWIADQVRNDVAWQAAGDLRVGYLDVSYSAWHE